MISFLKKYRVDIIFWVLYVAYQVLSEYFYSNYLVESLDTFFINVVYVFNVYVIIFVLNRTHKYPFYIKVLLIVSTYIVFIATVWVYTMGVTQLIGQGGFYKQMKTRDLMVLISDYYVRYLFFACGLYFLKNFNRSENKLSSATSEKLNLEKKNFELQAQNLELQNQKLKLQYSFLKAQINPHFLYNTLSFFYSKVLTNDKQTAEGIALLTDIMRYSLQQGEADGKVELDDEVTHLTNYMNLQQMRFNNTLNIHFDKNIEPERYRILPHIFITLVENAFKHGEVNNPLHPLHITLCEKDERLFFTVRDKIRNGPKDGPGTGVGLTNIETRLKMEYGNEATLESSAENDFFTVILSIPLKLLEKKSKAENANKNYDQLLVTL